MGRLRTIRRKRLRQIGQCRAHTNLSKVERKAAIACYRRDVKAIETVLGFVGVMTKFPTPSK